ncbi:transmembrane protein 45A-like isoform X2 [Peromyscus californicus insignis]|uniref:transmembrane protein 45A-like isoform X2 n=1 Tax=Peromyscus californicus insignis TaxID=564181 RepID=UPI0022A6C938|nr:transmembrane protein 45A-like isoform X2 [Peromyscus californicus insignis]
MNVSEARTDLKHLKVPGDFQGHFLAGTLFLIIALWWSTKSILKHVCKQQKRSSSLITKEFFFRAELLEGIVIIGMASVGIIGLYIALSKIHQFSDKESRLTLILHWHHLAMYVFFAILGGTKILCSIFSSLPVSLVKLTLSSALFVEGLVAFIEFLTKNNVVLELLRSSLTMLQGMWFYQISFVLYPKNRNYAWDLSDHSNVMFLTICFCLYYALTYAIIGINYALVTWLVKWRLSKLCTSETQLLKNHEQQEESEDEI